MSNENPTSAEESWAATNAKRDAEREQINAEHRGKYIGKRALVVADITIPHGVEIIPIAKKGEHINIIDADTLNHGWLNNVKIRTANGTEEWVDSMCLRLQE